FHARQAESMALRFHAQTAGVTLTAQQPEINAVRVAVQALAAVLGGAQSLHTNSMDEALSLPSEKAVRLALRTQQILAHESGVAEPRSSRSGRPRGREHDARDPRSRAGQGDARGDQRRASVRLWDIPAEAERMIGPAHHVGVAVRSLDAALADYRTLGFEAE